MAAFDVERFDSETFPVNADEMTLDDGHLVFSSLDCGTVHIIAPRAWKTGKKTPKVCLNCAKRKRGDVCNTSTDTVCEAHEVTEATD